MGLIARPTKEGGANSYAGKVALGFDDILAEEFDDEADVMFGLVNGNLNAANLADLAVTTAKLANGAVNDSKVASNANINGSKLLNNSIPNTKLQTGSTIYTRNQVHDSVINAPFNNIEVPIQALNITPRGPIVEIYAAVAGYLTIIQDGLGREVGLKLYRSGNPNPLGMQRLTSLALPSGLPGTFRIPFYLSMRYSDVLATPGVVNTYGMNIVPVLGVGGAVTSAQINLVEPA